MVHYVGLSGGARRENNGAASCRGKRSVVGAAPRKSRHGLRGEKEADCRVVCFVGLDCSGFDGLVGID
jgi:hypothetical protein